MSFPVTVTQLYKRPSTTNFSKFEATWPGHKNKNNEDKNENDDNDRNASPPAAPRGAWGDGGGNSNRPALLENSACRQRIKIKNSR